MKRLVAIFALAGSLCACAHQPELVQVPVAVPCSPPPVLARPHLPVADLTADTPANQVMKAYLASLETLKGYAAELEKLLDGYRGGDGGR